MTETNYHRNEVKFGLHCGRSFPRDLESGASHQQISSSVTLEILWRVACFTSSNEWGLLTFIRDLT